MTQAATFRTS